MSNTEEMRKLISLYESLEDVVADINSSGKSKIENVDAENNKNPKLGDKIITRIYLSPHSNPHTESIDVIGTIREVIGNSVLVSYRTLKRTYQKQYNIDQFYSIPYVNRYYLDNDRPAAGLDNEKFNWNITAQTWVGEIIDKENDNIDLVTDMGY